MAIKELLKSNAKYAEAYAKTSKASLPRLAQKNVIVVTCMDPRLDPARMLGLEEGDATIIRNAGGVAVEAIRSIVVGQLLANASEIMLLHHTDCGMLSFTQEKAEMVVQKNTGHSAAHINFHAFPDLIQSVKDDVKLLREEKLIPDSVKIWGGIYKLETGEIEEVVV